jgi:hypothetical protein
MLFYIFKKNDSSTTHPTPQSGHYQDFHPFLKNATPAKG